LRVFFVAATAKLLKGCHQRTWFFNIGAE